MQNANRRKSNGPNMGRIQESKERIRKEEKELECIICKTSGSTNPKEIILQSTPSGLVCQICVNRIVADIVFMKTPWDEKDLKKWAYERGEEE